MLTKFVSLGQWRRNSPSGSTWTFRWIFFFNRKHFTQLRNLNGDTENFLYHHIVYSLHDVCHEATKKSHSDSEFIYHKTFQIFPISMQNVTFGTDPVWIDLWVDSVRFESSRLCLKLSRLRNFRFLLHKPSRLGVDLEVFTWVELKSTWFIFSSSRVDSKKGVGSNH